jgi:hypothetical protein
MEQEQQLYIYARLLNESDTPINIGIIPTVFSIDERSPNKHLPGSLGSRVRVVGNVPSEFADLPGMEKCYKVELISPDRLIQGWIEQCMSMPACCINTLNIKIHSSVGHVELPDGAVAHGVECSDCGP